MKLQTVVIFPVTVSWKFNVMPQYLLVLYFLLEDLTGGPLMGNGHVVPQFFSKAKHMPKLRKSKKNQMTSFLRVITFFLLVSCYIASKGLDISAYNESMEQNYW
jgi:hypothetical protein